MLFSHGDRKPHSTSAPPWQRPSKIFSFNSTVSPTLPGWLSGTSRLKCHGSWVTKLKKLQSLQGMVFKAVIPCAFNWVPTISLGCILLKQVNQFLLSDLARDLHLSYTSKTLGLLQCDSLGIVYVQDKLCQ